MRKKEGRKMTWTEKMVLLNELQKEDERRQLRMTDEEIDELWLGFKGNIKRFTREIEKRHGIK